MADSAYLAPPFACERLEHMLARFGGTLEVFAAPAEPDEPRGEYPLPTHGPDEVRAHLERHRVREPEPDFIARLPGGRVFGPGVVVAPDGRSLARDVSTDFGKRFEDHWLLSYAKIRPPVRVAGTTAVVAVALGKGYCHWLLEELPRFLMLDRRANLTLIAHRKQPFIDEVFRLGRFSGRVLEAKRYSHFQCEELVVPSLIGRSGRPTPRVVRLLTGFAEPLRAPGCGLGERLYITREKAGRRRVTNEAALWRRLEGRGFKKVHLEDLSWADQINAFAHAREIVAPHGAGLANLVFCPPAVRVVELFDRAYVNPCFWQLAGIKGLDYRPLATAGSGPLACDPRANRNDILADIESVLKALA